MTYREGKDSYTDMFEDIKNDANDEFDRDVTLKQVFNCTIECEDGSKIRMRSLSTPEDFLLEAKRDERKSEHYFKKARMRMELYGEDDQKSKEFMFAAESSKYSMEQNRSVSEMLRKTRSTMSYNDND